MRIRFSRDFVVLPLLALATFAGCLAAAEGFAQLVMPQELRDSCESVKGHDANCVSRMKVAEGPAVTMRYNECGSRSAASCFAPPPRNYRIVTLGTSVSNGYGVRLENMYSTVAAARLAESCKRPVDFQHVAIGWAGSSPEQVAGWLGPKTEEALALKPDVLLVVVTSWDLYKYAPAEEAPAGVSATASLTRFSGLRDTSIFKFGKSVMGFLREQRESSRFVLMARHMLYRNEDYFLTGHLSNVEEDGYLQPTYTPSWERRVAMFETAMLAVDAKAKAAGVPVAIIYQPGDALTLLARRDRPDLDAKHLGRRFAEIAARHGWTFIDPLPGFAASPRNRDLFYRVNGHPNGAGHRLLGQSLAEALATASTPGCM